MAEDTNTTTLVGRLTRDADIRDYGSDGRQVANIRLAFTTRNNRGGEWTDQSNFINVVKWQVGGLAQYLTKGTQIAVTGRLEMSEWTDKDGRDRQEIQVVAHQVQLLNSRGENTQQGPPHASNDIPAAQTLPGTGGGSRRTTDPDSIDIPFAASLA